MTLCTHLAAIAAESPDRPFAKDSKTTVSYSQAVHKANQVAAWLQAQKFFDVSTPIFTYFEPKPEYLPTLLGVIQSGMPWVGLDPSFPAGHNQRVLGWAERPQILTAQPYTETVSALSETAEITFLEDLGPAKRSAPFVSPVSNEHALIVFSSGSTQEPKGVQRGQADLLANALAQAQAMDLGAGTIVASAYSPSVMGFLRAFLNTIVAGGCYRPVQLAEAGEDHLFNVLKSGNVNMLHIVAPVFRKLFASLDSSDSFPSISKIVLGGDAATPLDFDLYKAHFARTCQIYSGLGSSEAGTISVWAGNQDYLPERDKLPCGQLLPSVEVLIDLDGSLRKPVANEIGELLVSSPHLAKDYWLNDPLTKEKWVPGPEGKTYYRTGDLVAFDEMEVLHHFGRVDTAAKINGVLVDPANVEYVLNGHPEIKEAAVEIDKASHRGKPVVEAFLVLGDGFDKAEFGRFVETNIVDAAQPSLLYQMDELPRTRNGKVMRSSLMRNQPFLTRTTPVLVDKNSTSVLNKIWWRMRAKVGRPFSPRTKVDPVNETNKRALKEIWSRVLEVDEISDDENFLALGGDSLVLIVLALEIERCFDTRLTVEELSSALNLADMARLIDRKTTDEQVTVRPIVVLSNVLSSWDGHAVSDDGLIRTMAEESPIDLYWCLQNESEFTQLSAALTGKIDLKALRTLNLLLPRTPEHLDAVAIAYADAIMADQSRTGRPLNLGGNCQGSTLMFQVAQILSSRGVEINHFIMMEKFIDAPAAFPLSMLFGESSERNIYRTGELTVDIARELYPALRGISEIGGAHGEFFIDENIPTLSGEIMAALEA